MASAIRQRVRRLEAATRAKAQTVRVVSGPTPEEHARQIAAMIERGEAQESDLFVCLRKFSEKTDEE